MAEKLGMPSSSYTRYETPQRYKKPYLPMPLARQIARVLGDHQIDQAEVMALAVDREELIGRDLSVGEEQLLDHFRHLDAAQRRLLLQLAEAMDAAAASALAGGDAKGSPDSKSTVHAGRQAYRAGAGQ